MKVAFSGMCVLALTSFLPGMVGALAGAATVPFILFLPGYAVSMAFFGSNVDGFERIAVAIGLDLTVLILGGLLLNLLPIGLTNVTWSVFIVTVTAVGMWVATVRGSWSSGAQFQSFNLRQGGIVQVVLLGISLVLVGGAVVFDIVGAQDQPNTTFTQLWMVPSPKGSSVSLGILNDEGADAAYRLRVFVGHRTVAEWVDIRLAANQRWTRRLLLPRAVVAEHQAVHATLFRSGSSPTPYRKVDVFMPS